MQCLKDVATIQRLALPPRVHSSAPRTTTVCACRSALLLSVFVQFAPQVWPRAPRSSRSEALGAHPSVEPPSSDRAPLIPLFCGWKAHAVRPTAADFCFWRCHPQLEACSRHSLRHRQTQSGSANCEVQHCAVRAPSNSRHRSSARWPPSPGLVFGQIFCLICARAEPKGSRS